MKIEIIKDKEGNPYINEEGNELVEKKFDSTDEFIPIYNNISEREFTKNDGGKATDYTLLCMVRNKDTKEEYYNGGENKHFIKLTPTQAERLKKISKEHDINQNIFRCYDYKNDKGTFVGVGLKKELKEPIDFVD